MSCKERQVVQYLGKDGLSWALLLSVVAGSEDRCRIRLR